jgi:isoamyl acetate esterase
LIGSVSQPYTSYMTTPGSCPATTAATHPPMCAASAAGRSPPNLPLLSRLCVSLLLGRQTPKMSQFYFRAGGSQKMVRPRLVLFGDSITEQSFRPGGWGAALADTYSRKVFKYIRPSPSLSCLIHQIVLFTSGKCIVCFACFSKL